MIHFFRLLLSSIALFTLAGCQPKKPAPISFTILQLNDVYEIGKIQKGNYGGLARVATLKKQLLAENPNTIAVIAGDFLNPSVIGTIKMDGHRIKGKQMVESLNVMGMDYAVFGNHEFDLKLPELQQRLQESDFQWVSTNVHQNKSGQRVPFKATEEGKLTPIPTSRILEFTGEGGKTLKVGMIGITLDGYPKKYLIIDDMFASAKAEVEKLQPQVDFVIALTHMSIGQDEQLAEEIPSLKLIMGGHEHQTIFKKVGDVAIAKADANAYSAYVHRFEVNGKSKEVKLVHELVKIDSSFTDDPETANVVKKWEALAFGKMKENGLNPDEKVFEAEGQPLNGLEREIRNHPTNLTRLITEAMFQANDGADLAILNAGAIRVDDQLSGVITQYDVVRILPFGGGTPLVEIKGELLQKIVKAGEANIGSGGLLHYHGLKDNGETVFIQSKPLNANKWYKVVIADFLLTGKESRLSFLTLQNPQIRLWKEQEGLNLDIQKTLISHMKTSYEKQEANETPTP